MGRTLEYLVTNLVILVGVALPILIFELFGTPPTRGFYCNDETIALPYHRDTISTTTAFVIGLAVPLITILFVEHFYLRPRKQLTAKLWPPLPDNRNQEEDFINMCLGFLFGAAASHSLVTIAKYTIGRLRPHFLDVCQPDYLAIDCGTQQHPIYVTNYTCLGNQDLFPNGTEMQEAIDDARVSFLSGHTSFMFQAAVFTIFYLQARVASFNVGLGASLLVPALQVTCFAGAYWVALTRIQDYMHHPGDVLAGAMLGAATQVVNVLYVMKLFAKRPLDKHQPIEDDLTLKNVVWARPNYQSNELQRLLK